LKKPCENEDINQFNFTQKKPIFQSRRPMIKLNPLMPPKTPSKLDIELKKVQSLKRFKSLQQKPFCKKFLRERICSKLEFLGMDEYDMNEELYEGFIDKMIENLFSKSKERRPINLDTVLK